MIERNDKLLATIRTELARTKAFRAIGSGSRTPAST
jgi:hypothetical protein